MSKGALHRRQPKDADIYEDGFMEKVFLKESVIANPSRFCNL
jgi:hypothetical protein